MSASIPTDTLATDQLETNLLETDPLELVPLATVSVAAGETHRIEGGPFSDRILAAIADGRWEGPRVSGDIVGAGGDWALQGPDGIKLLDVRQVLRTDDGAIIYVTYKGRGDSNRGTYTVAPTFETSDPRYTWLNAVQAIGRGARVGNRLEYRMYEVR